MNIARVRVSLLITSFTFVFYCKNLSIGADDNCTCEYRPEDDVVGPFCSDWIHDYPPFCYLSGGLEGKFCPDAIKSEGGNFYWTENKTVCEKSSGYVEKIVNVTIMVR